MKPKASWKIYGTLTATYYRRITYKLFYCVLKGERTWILQMQ
nr:MAG TPA: hypothetical protein [Bacteriophage sp.]